MSYNVGDILIAKRTITWRIDQHTTGKADQGDLFIVISCEPSASSWVKVPGSVTYDIDLLGANHIIRWTPRWSPMQFLFDRVCAYE